ncbi:MULTISPECIES: DUF736 family protein [unclassified Ensifer]|uniref:DUF736 family protein n=1 Tax=unclassified Ensifer TaxID=2633371 RepID=UPI0030100580
MPQIGQFSRTKSGYAGTLRTLSLNVELVLEHAESSDAENAPDFRIHLGEDGPEIGAGWKRTGENRPARTEASGVSTGTDLKDAPTGIRPMRIAPPARVAPATPGLPRAVRLSALLLLSGIFLASIANVSLFAQSKPTVRPATGGPYATHVNDAARRFAIPTSWIRSVMRVESAGEVHALSRSGAMGLMQIMPDTWAELGARHHLGDDPYDPRDNILAGAAYLREMHDRYGAPGFLAAYNAGPARYDEYLRSGRPLPAETRAYVAAIAPLLGVGDLPSATTPRASDETTWWQAPLFITPASLTKVGKPRSRPSRAGGAEIEPSSHNFPALKTHSNGLFVERSDPRGEQ